MRLTSILLLSAAMHVSATVRSQKVTLSLEHVPVQKVFAEVFRQTGISIVYTESMFKDFAPVSITVHDASVQDVLDKCFKDQPFAYMMEGSMITIKKTFTSPISPTISEIPPGDIHGHVSDSLGNPLAGASVIVKGSRKGTQTDSKGDFILYGVTDNATLVISFTGYTKKLVNINKGSSVSVALNKSNDPLDEIQVIAYGTTTKRLSVGNITTVTAETIEKQPVQNVLLALQNQAPGLFITPANGLNGAGISVRIQGQNSIAMGNDPFYVIDGVPYASQLNSTGFDFVFGSTGTGGGPYTAPGSPLNFINPSDIESVEVLKDADATAIYGSRAANGAILITTKKGKAGAMRFNMNLQQGYSEVGHFSDMMNTQQYLAMRHQAFKNDGFSPSSADYDINGTWDTTRYTNWQKTLIGGTAGYTNITGSISGGTSLVQYLVSGTYHRQSTVFPGSFADQDGALHFSLTSASVNQKFHFQLSGMYMIDDNKLPGYDLTGASVTLEPDAPALYNKDGSLNWAQNAAGISTWYNPLAPTVQTFERKTNNLVSNAVLSYNIVPGLDVKTSFGYTDLRLDDYTPYPLTIYPPEQRIYYSLMSIFGNSTSASWIVEPQITYKRNISKGKLDLLFGGTIQQNQSEANAFQGTGYSNEQLMQDIQAATTINSFGTSFNQYKYAALYGRANYVWEDKYIIDLTGRRDGSSRFGTNNQYHDFWSVGAGWIFSEEEFFKSLKLLSFGKLHGSYGTTGNDQIPNYEYLSLFFPTFAFGLPYQNTSGLFPAGLSNPGLQWEETRKLQVGIDLGFVNNRILLNVMFATNRSSNQLLRSPLPRTTGFNAVEANLPAIIQNTDWEFTLNTVNIKTKDFNWTSRIVLTIPYNKLVSYPGLATSSLSYAYVLGQPLNIKRVSHYLGVDPATGKYMFADKKGEPTLNPIYPLSYDDPGDYTKILNLDPTFYGMLQNTISYKGFQLDFTFSFTKQLQLNYSYFNGTGITPGEFYAGSSNQPSSVLNSWKNPGNNAAVTAYSTQYSSTIANLEGSDYAYTNGSYIRLQNVALTWQMPKNWLMSSHLQNASIYFQGQNLLTFTPDKNVLDPTTGISGLPPLRTLTLGLKLGL